jgi:hypothetical protein
MFTRIRKLVAGPKASSPKPTSSFRPQFEALESREVQSTATGGMHTVAPPPGHLTQQIEFHIDARSHLLVENGTAINGAPNTPSGVRLLSAGHGARGGADVFVTASDGAMWKFDQGTWTKILKPTADKVLSFAAVDGGRAIAALQNVATGGITLDEYNGSGWVKIPAIGTPSQVDAVTDTSGRDVAFVLNADGSMYDYGQFNPGSAFLSDKLFNGGRPLISRITQFSAGLDAQGDAQVYATINSPVLHTSNLFKNKEGSSPSGWLQVGQGQFYTDFSATNNGAVWIAGTNHSVFELDQFGHIVSGSGRGNAFAATLGAAADGDVYFVDTSGSLHQWVNSPNVGWEDITLTGPGAVQV